jgi:predicted amidohydrolase YtcJ
MLLGAVGVLMTVHAQEPGATSILLGGTIYTANPAQPVVEAVAVRDGRIVRAGTRSEVLALKGASTATIDVQGATVVPGFQDAHGHVLGLGRSQSILALRDTPSVQRITEMVNARVATAASDEWVLGHGWDQNDWTPKAWPTREDLDRVAPNQPVVLTRIDGHALWANSRALDLAGITPTTSDPPGGRILRDDAGRPTGIFVDAAQALITSHVPPPTDAQVLDWLTAADREMTRVGLTMVHDAGEPSAVIAAMRQLVSEQRFATRLYVMIDSSPQTTGEWFQRGPLIDAEQHLTVRAVKMYADGALGSRGAALLEPYADEPSNRGLLITPPEELEAIARAAAAAGFQPATHAIGDRANRLVLDAYGRIEHDIPGARALRPRIEHAQILDAADIPRFAALGVIASMQPTHCTSDMPWAPVRLGPERVVEGAYVWHKLLDSGARLAAGSDFPVERPDPLLGFYAAVTRQTVAGEPAGGWAPDQRLTRDEALRAFTFDAAYAAHAERDLGSIEVGKLADFVVLSRDIMKVPAADIPTTTVLRTIIQGRTVYEAPHPSPSGL